MTRREYYVYRNHLFRHVLLCLVLFWTLVAFGCVRMAEAHSWYSYACCSDRDCAPMPKPLWPQPVASGWLLYDGTVWPYVDTKIAPDSQFHECKRPDGKRLCLYAPTAGI